MASTIVASALFAAPVEPRTAGQEVSKMHARGEFEVQVTPVALDGPAEDASFGRLTLVKKLTGDFIGVGRGQMLSATGSVPTSGAYVAVERLTGKLGGREGSFALYHRGSMTERGYEMQIEVVPDSGTGALAGISGVFRITIEGKKHFYDFEYELPASP
jgi:hypothetical protein